MLMHLELFEQQCVRAQLLAPEKPLRSITACSDSTPQLLAQANFCDLIVSRLLIPRYLYHTAPILYMLCRVNYLVLLQLLQNQPFLVQLELQRTLRQR